MEEIQLSSEMSRYAVKIYTNLYKPENWDKTAVSQLLSGLTHLEPVQRTRLDSAFSLDEVSTAVPQLSSGHSPGIDGLQADV